MNAAGNASSTGKAAASPLVACGSTKRCRRRCCGLSKGTRSKPPGKLPSRSSSSNNSCGRPSNWKSNRLATKARLAARRYEAVDPEQRLVARELEARWNVALQKVQELEDKLEEFDRNSPSATLPSREVLLSLAQDLPAVWNSPSADMRLKQRILHILIREIIADVDENSREIVLLIHWAGGHPSELRVKKGEGGKNRYCTSLEATEVIRKMAGQFSDEQIARFPSRRWIGRPCAGQPRILGIAFASHEARAVLSSNQSFQRVSEV